LAVIVAICDRQSDLALKQKKKKIRQIVQTVLAEEHIAPDEVALFFLSAQAMCKMHLQYFNDERLTDCISFPMDNPQETGYFYLGDIFVCPHAALIYTHEGGSDPYRETTLYIVHGLLHLIGYDDRHLGDRRKMRQKETLHMEKLAAKELILSP
jgi:probable rRNA maturation factor